VKNKVNKIFPENPSEAPFRFRGDLSAYTKLFTLPKMKEILLAYKTKNNNPALSKGMTINPNFLKKLGFCGTEESYIN